VGKGGQRTRSNETEVSKRIAKVSELLIDGNQRAEIIEFSRETWRVGDKQADKYIAAAKQQIRNREEKDRTDNIQMAVARRDSLYRDARNKGDIRAALEVDKDLRKLQGLYTETISLTATEMPGLSTVNELNTFYVSQYINIEKQRKYPIADETLFRELLESSLPAHDMVQFFSFLTHDDFDHLVKNGYSDDDKRCDSECESSKVIKVIKMKQKRN
jgi:hypothetical protein